MYKALLVDQPHVCRIVRDTVDWEKLGTSCTVHCADGNITLG